MILLVRKIPSVMSQLLVRGCPHPPPPVDPLKNNEAIALQGCTILVVDEDKAQCDTLSAILRHEQFKAETADSGPAAIARYAEVQPDLVLMDVVMPGMSGFEACRELRRIHGSECAPVIFITGRHETKYLIDGFNSGGVDYITKPFELKEMIARIRTHLSVRTLLAQQRMLVEKLSRENKFLGMAAHDLRNPLCSIRGLSECLLEGLAGKLGEEQTSIVASIHEASQGTLQLVNDLLDIATIEAGQFHLHIMPIRLSELVQKSVALNGMEAARKNTSIVLQDKGTSPSVMLDADKIHQVIDNLLSNAIKYSPPGSTITVAMQTTPSEHVISVRDEGPGIPENERDRLFQDFGRLSPQPTGGEKSIGLGLAICKKIIQAHCGNIIATNLPTRGCEFRITLPLDPIP